jgi:hypothetical protein
VKPVTQALTATKGASPETEEVGRGKEGFVAKQFPMVAQPRHSR